MEEVNLKLPWLFHANSAVSEDWEEAEILSKAFKDAAGNYFMTYANYEQKRIRYFQGLIIGIVLTVVGMIALIPLRWVGATLLLFSVILSAVMAYEQNRVKVMQQNLKPDKKLIYLTKMYVPLYFVPYADKGSFLFDSLGNGDDYVIDSIRYDVDVVSARINSLIESVNRYRDLTAEKSVLTAPMIKMYNKDAFDNRLMTSDVVGQLEALKENTGESVWIKESIKVNVHNPKGDLSTALKIMWKHLKSIGNDILAIKERYNINYFIEKLEAIGKIEKENIEGEMGKIVEMWRDRVIDEVYPILENFEDKIGVTEDYYGKYYAINDLLSKRQICPKCYKDALSKYSASEEEIKSANDLYNLENFVIRNFAEAIHTMSDKIRCPNVIDGVQCPGFLEERDGKYVCNVCGAEFTPEEVEGIESDSEKAKSLLKQNINVDINPIPMEGVLYLDNMQPLMESGINWKCKKHQDVEESQIVEYPILSDAFAPAAKNIWDVEIIGPVREKVLNAKDKAMSHRETFKSHKLMTIPYKEIAVNFDVMSDKILSDIQEADMMIGKYREFLEKYKPPEENKGKKEGSLWRKIL